MTPPTTETTTRQVLSLLQASSAAAASDTITPERDELFRASILAQVSETSAPWTEWHTSLSEQPPPPPARGSSWIRVQPQVWRLAADPPTGRTWSDFEILEGSYRKRFVDPELTELQIGALLAIPGNRIQPWGESGHVLRIAGPFTPGGCVGLPQWHRPSDFEPYDFFGPSVEVSTQLPNLEVRRAYSTRDGNTDWLRFVRDQFEAKLGYPQIMAFWQYLDERHRRTLPGVTEAALESGIPKLRPTNVPKYIAAVSLALQAKRVSQEEANAMLYAAQLLIGALKVVGVPTKGKPRGRHAPRALSAPTSEPEYLP